MNMRELIAKKTQIKTCHPEIKRGLNDTTREGNLSPRMNMRELIQSKVKLPFEHRTEWFPLKNK